MSLNYSSIAFQHYFIYINIPGINFAFWPAFYGALEDFLLVEGRTWAADGSNRPEDASWRHFDERARRMHRESQSPLASPKPNRVAANASPKRTIDNLEVNNNFTRFETERSHQAYADSVKARYLSPETKRSSIAHEQIRELLHLLGEERDLTNSLQDRLDQEIMMSHGFELDTHENPNPGIATRSPWEQTSRAGSPLCHPLSAHTQRATTHAAMRRTQQAYRQHAARLREKHNHALEAVDDLP